VRIAGTPRVPRGSEFPFSVKFLPSEEIFPAYKSDTPESALFVVGTMRQSTAVLGQSCALREDGPRQAQLMEGLRMAKKTLKKGKKIKETKTLRGGLNGGTTH
jgi:hypothetical protein